MTATSLPRVPSTSEDMPHNPDQRFWDRAARKYAESPVEDPAGYENTLARTRKLLSADDHVLELGCGTGSTALRLASAVASYVATDLSPEMITIANHKQSALAPGSSRSSLRFAAQSAFAAAGEDDASYDVVIAMNLLHLVPDLDATLAEVRRALRPGGLFISKTACIKELNIAIRCALPLMRLIGKAPGNVLSFTEQQLLDALERNGLHVECVERHGVKGTDVRPFIVARAAAS